MDFERQLSKESPNLYRACALDNGSVAAEETFELRTGELKVLEGMRRLAENYITKYFQASLENILRIVQKRRKKTA